MPSIDFDLFLEQVDLTAVARALNIGGRFHSAWVRCPCPVCKHADERCCHVKWDDDKWYCHRCRRGGGPIQLACHLLNKGPYEAVVIICNRLGLDVPYRERVRTRRRHPRRDPSGELIDDADEDGVT